MGRADARFMRGCSLRRRLSKEIARTGGWEVKVLWERAHVSSGRGRDSYFVSTFDIGGSNRVTNGANVISPEAARSTRRKTRTNRLQL